MSKISERIKHTNVKEGYCVICGKYGRLSKDHVPPKGSVNILATEQRHITEAMGVQAKSFKGVKSLTGSYFKTICKECNESHLGENDAEVKRVYNLLTDKVRNYFLKQNSISNFISIELNTISFARAMIGHILSATSAQECLKPPVDTPYFSPLQKFVMGDDLAISNTHDIYYWFFPHKFHLSAKIVAFRNQGHNTVVSILSFFPMAFMVTKKNQGTFPGNAKELDLNSNHIYLDLSSLNMEFSTFPFVNLRGDCMYALNDSQAIISHPIRSK